VWGALSVTRSSGCIGYRPDLPGYGTTRTVSDPAKLSPSSITPVSVRVAFGGATMAFTASSLNLATRFPQESASVETTSTPLS